MFAAAHWCYEPSEWQANSQLFTALLRNGDQLDRDKECRRERASNTLGFFARQWSVSTWVPYLAPSTGDDHVHSAEVANEGMKVHKRRQPLHCLISDAIRRTTSGTARWYQHYPEEDYLERHVVPQLDPAITPCLRRLKHFDIVPYATLYYYDVVAMMGDGVRGAGQERIETAPLRGTETCLCHQR